MPEQLSPQEVVALQADTDFLNAGIPVWGSRVTTWATMIILIYHTKDIGYVVSNISDLPASTIAELVKVSDVHGIWYYLPQSLQDVIAERAEEVADTALAAGAGLEEALKRVATDIGQTLGNLLNPLVETLMIPLVIGVAIALIYLTKKG